MQCSPPSSSCFFLFRPPLSRSQAFSSLCKRSDYNLPLFLSPTHNRLSSLSPMHLQFFILSSPPPPTILYFLYLSYTYLYLLYLAHKILSILCTSHTSTLFYPLPPTIYIVSTTEAQFSIFSTSHAHALACVLFHTHTCLCCHKALCASRGNNSRFDRSGADTGELF